MKPTTLFALIFAVLLGLGALATARFLGLFRQPPAAVAETRIEAKIEPTMILAARNNLYEGFAMLPGDVQVRALQPHEAADFKANPRKYLPPMLEAASMRVLKRNVEANQPLLQEYLEPQAVPEGLGLRLAPRMRAVHVSLPKDHAVGGVIRVGEYVDVMLTSNIIAGNSKVSGPRTAVIARNLRVILKRDMLWTVLASVPDDKPLHFTLEANPYRAVLLEFARDKGQMTLVPTPMPSPTSTEPSASFADPTSKEYMAEDERVAAILQGDKSIGENDLERIFGLAPLPRVEPPSRVEIFVGNRLKETKEYEPQRPEPLATAGLGYRFLAPAAQPQVETPAAPKKAPTGQPSKK